MLSKYKFRNFLFAALGLLLVGCGDSSMSDLRSFVDDAFKDEKPDIPPLPPVIPFKPFAYAAAEDNDPFSLANIGNGGADGGAGAGVQIGDRPDQDRRKEELENYPLDALRMVGTLSKDSKPWVVIKTTQGLVQLATVGNYIGENYGKIKRVSIEEQVVNLTETVLDPTGRWVTRDVEITVDEQ